MEEEVEQKAETINTGDLESTVKTIFSSDPRPPNSVRFDLHPEDLAGDSIPHATFRLLGQILTHGIVYLFGPNVSLSSLSPDDILFLKEHMYSLGYTVLFGDNNIKNYSKRPENQKLILPWILKIRDSPNSSTFHPIMFCKLP